MKHVFTAVEPIRPGYDWQTRIVLPQAFWNAEGISEAARLVAHFRSSLPGTLLAVADTFDHTITREDPSTLLIELDAVNTLLFSGSAIAVFDIVAIAIDGTQRPIPGRWTWPVVPTVTRTIDGELPTPDFTISARPGIVQAIFEWAAPTSLVDWQPAIVPGPAGVGLHIVASEIDLREGFGREGDRAIVRTTGEEWVKQDGGWTEAGEQFLATLLPDTIEARNAAREWAADAERFKDAAEAAANDERIGTVAAHIGEVEAVADAAVAVGMVAASIEDIQDVAAISTQVAIVASSHDSISQVAASQGIIDAVADRLAAVEAVADSIADVALVSTNIANVGVVAGDIQAVRTVADRDADIAVVAARDADVGAVAAALGSIETVVERIDDIGTVAARDADIGTVAARDADIEAVAADAEDIGAVAASIADVNLAADNMALIQSAPALAAQTAGDVLSTAANVGVTNAAKAEAIAEALKAKASADNSAASYAALAAALSGISNYDNTLAQLTGGARLVVSAPDVVAHYVYDTANDSDGGKWRHRCKHTSWYNEALNTATRGAKAKFPRKALIVARPASVTIYDYDDRACPMWMVFNASGSVVSDVALIGTALTGINSVVAANGNLYVGTSNTGLTMIDFMGDRSFRARPSGTVYGTHKTNIAGRNAGAGDLADRYMAVASAVVNSVAATIYPGTPPDPRRAGLPTPCVGVGTAGGVSVIHADGRVCNSANTSNVPRVAFERDGTLLVSIPNVGVIFRALPSVYAAASFALIHAFKTPGQAFVAPAFLVSNSLASFPLAADAFGNTSGLTLFGPKTALPLTTPVAYLTSTYLTGWQIGDIKLALAESTADVTSLVGQAALFDDFSTYANDAALNAVWLVYSTATAGILTLSSGGIRVDNNSVGTFTKAVRAISTVIGRRYTVRGNLLANSGNAYVRAGLAASGIAPDLGGIRPSVGPFQLSFIATATTTYISLHADNANTTGYAVFDDIRVDASVSDRSAAGNNPVVVGTINRAPVATGAELAAIRPAANSGLEVASSVFSSAGAGDFSINFWLAGDAAGSTQYLMLVRNAPDTGNGMFIQRGSISGVAALTVRVPGGSELTTVTGFKDAVFRLVNIVRRSGQLELWVNGVREVTAANSGDLTSAFAPVAHLLKDYQNVAAANCQLALFRISATAPTPAQIRAMYADEAPLFQPGAKCLLTGSDNVQGVDFDATTGLLYAAKAAGGTDVFKGLQRVGSMTMASENSLGPELITNGTFDTDLTGWTGSGSEPGGTFVWDAGTARITFGNPGSARARTTVATEVGKTYRLYFDLPSANGAISVSIGTAAGGAQILLGQSHTAGSGYIDFVATTTTTHIQFAINATNATRTFDNVSCRMLLAAPMNSNNHKAVSATGDHVSIVTAAEVYAKLPAIGLREMLGHNGGPALYDRDVAEFEGVTSNATPTVIARLPLDKGERGFFTVTVTAWHYGDGAQYAAYIHEFEAYRPEEGNVQFQAAVATRVHSETTSTMDSVVTATPATQTIDLTVTGVANTPLVWRSEWVRRA